MNQTQIFMGIMLVALLLFTACAKETTDTTGAEATNETAQPTESTTQIEASEQQQNTESATEEQTETTEEQQAEETTGTSAMRESTMMPDSQTSEDDQTTSESSTSTTTTETTSESGVDEFTVKAFRFGYQPETLTVKKGDLVKITIENKDGMHGMKLLAFGVQDMDYVEFTADKAGTYTWYCNNFCGSGHSSMSGTLTVEE